MQTQVSARPLPCSIGDFKTSKLGAPQCWCDAASSTANVSKHRVNDFLGLIHDFAGLIHDFAGLIHDFAGLMNEFAGLVNGIAECVNGIAERANDFGSTRE